MDLDGDIFRLKKYVHTRRHASPEDQRVKYKFTVNGAIDVQNVAHTIGETSFSLDKLSHKYVEDFVGNPSELGSYRFPTQDQYIYAANDAILSLKIYGSLISRSPCQRWKSAQQVKEEEAVEEVVEPEEEVEEELVEEVQQKEELAEVKEEKPVTKKKKSAKKRKAIKQKLEADSKKAVQNKESSEELRMRLREKLVIRRNLDKPTVMGSTLICLSGGVPFLNFEALVKAYPGMTEETKQKAIVLLLGDKAKYQYTDLEMVVKTMIDSIGAISDQEYRDLLCEVLEITDQDPSTKSKSNSRGVTHSYTDFSDGNLVSLLDEMPLLVAKFPDPKVRYLAATAYVFWAVDNKHIYFDHSTCLDCSTHEMPK